MGKAQTKGGKSSCWMKLLFILSLAGAIFVGLDQIRDRFYIFDQNLLQSIAKKNIDLYSNDTHALITNLAEDLEKEYPGHITLKEEWVFNNAGGAMGTMWILHASITEYVIIFGSAGKYNY
jgi:C-8 sterol isomerase